MWVPAVPRVSSTARSCPVVLSIPVHQSQRWASIRRPAGSLPIYRGVGHHRGVSLRLPRSVLSLPDGPESTESHCDYDPPFNEQAATVEPTFRRRCPNEGIANRLDGSTVVEVRGRNHRPPPGEAVGTVSLRGQAFCCVGGRASLPGRKQSRHCKQHNRYPDHSQLFLSHGLLLNACELGPRCYAHEQQPRREPGVWLSHCFTRSNVAVPNTAPHFNTLRSSWTATWPRGQPGLRLPGSSFASAPGSPSRARATPFPRLRQRHW